MATQRQVVHIGTRSRLSPVPNKPYVASVDVKQHEKKSTGVQELCESGGGRPGLPVHNRDIIVQSSGAV